MVKGDNKRDNEKDKKDEENAVIKLVLVVIVSGLVLMGISILFEKGTELHYIIRGLGISIIGGALIAWAIGHLISKRKFSKLYEDMEELYGKITETDKNINKNVTETFKLIKETRDNGLLKIYEPYDMKFKKKEQISDEFTNEINKMVKAEEKEIKICGLSLREFFSDGRKFADEMRKAFERMDNNNNEFSVKVLLIDPESDWKKQREEAEDKFAKDKLGTDLGQSIVWLNNNIRNLEHEDKIKDNIRFYNATPDFFLFITSHCVLFENYHMGAFELEKETDRGVRALGLGGHVPVFKFDSKSPMYKYLNGQFDYYFEKKIDGRPNKYHARTLTEMPETFKE